MKKKIFFILLMLLMATVSISYAAVTVTINDVGIKSVNEDIIIPVSITEFNEFLAGELIFDFGATALTDITIEGGAGTLYPNGLEDYSAVAVLADLTGKNGWEATKDGAIDYNPMPLGSKVKVYLYAGDKTASAAGVLFNIKATVGASAKSGLLHFGGKLFNANKNTRATAAIINDSATLNITGETAVTVQNNLAAIPDTGNVQDPVDIGAATGGTGNVTTELTLKPTDPPPYTAISVKIEANTVLTQEDGSAFTGVLEPPKMVKLADFTADQKAKLPATWQADEDLVLFTVGSPTTKVLLDKPALTTLTVVRDAKAGSFKVYYVPENAEPELAGIDGTATYNGKEVSIKQGGTILQTLKDTPEAGKTQYIVGVLLDHMSDFVVADVLLPAPDGEAALLAEDDDNCFIATVAFGSIMEPSVKVLREFRDIYLLTNSVGQRFVDIYYRYSPDLAGLIARHDTLKVATRVALMPVVGISFLMLQSGISWPTAGLMALLFMVMAFGGVYHLRRRRQHIA